VPVMPSAHASRAREPTPFAAQWPVGLRLFPWDWTLSPFVDLAAGFGRASYHCCAYQEHAAQFLGRYGVGLELRLGPHVVLHAQVATVHRRRLDEPGFVF
jgi:hypothetical protein